MSAKKTKSTTKSKKPIGSSRKPSAKARPTNEKPEPVPVVERPTARAYYVRRQKARIEYSEDTARSIDKEIRAILGDAYTRAKDVLKSNLAILHSMAEALLEREVLDGKDIDEIISANGGSLPTGASA